MMPHIVGFVIASVLAKGTIGEHIGKCQDMDEQACILFQKAKPELCSDPTFSANTCNASVEIAEHRPTSTVSTLIVFLALKCYDCPNPVKQPSDCTTALCGVNQTCMLKQFTGSDGQAEFVMRCEDKALCEGVLHGFYNVPVGRRSLTSDHREDSPLKRDVSLSLSCCGTDFCNFPKISTTSATAATTIIASTSPGHFPNGCNPDIVFVLDDSGSVGSTNFRHALDFVKEIVRQLDIGPTKAQFAMLTFSSHPEINWYLNRYTTKQDLLSAVDSVRYNGGVTHTNAALQTVRNQVLTQAHGDRQMAKNVVIVLTDGQSNDRLDTIKEAGKLHSISDDVISIAIGSGINAQEIQAIATDNHHVFDLRSYNALNTIFSNLMQIICNA